MKLIAFFLREELLSPGLMAGEPTKGALLKTLEAQKPDEVLLIVQNEHTPAVEVLRKVLPQNLRLTLLGLDGVSQENMSQLLAAMRSQTEIFEPFKDADILNFGSPQERAALWILKNEGILKGRMINAPDDSYFIPDIPSTALKACEVEKPFDETAETSVDSWSTVAVRIGCIGKSPRFRQTLEEAAAMANHPTPILLMGETGCGKEVLARFIHFLSPRANKPLVTVNCAALPETLAESILFGHEKGSFTGAYKRQKGKFELADGGTLFLDELGELSMANQAKLLRVLETRTVDLLGGAEPMKVDVRVIAATNRNLQQEVAAGRFREDLYYRLRIGEIDIPTLRERKGDIPLIALHLLERLNSTLAHPKQFSKAALKFLEVQRWPGNVRDLMNTIERATLLCPRTVIEPEDFRVLSEPLRPNGTGNGAYNSLPSLYEGFAMEEYLQKIRHDLFEKALKQANGNRSEAARLLGLTPQAIHKFLKQLDIKTEEAKQEANA